MIEVLARESKRLRHLLHDPRLQIQGQEHVAVFSDAGRLWTPSRLAALIGNECNRLVVVRWVPLTEVRQGQPSWLSIACIAARIETLHGSLFPVGLGLALAHGPVSIVLAVSVAVTMSLLHLAANLANAAFEHIWGDDRAFRDAGAKVLLHGWAKAYHFLGVAVVLSLLAAVAGVYLALWMKRPWLLPVGIVSGLLAWQFNAPPLRLKRTLVGDGVLFLLFGPMLTVSVCYLASGSLPAGIWGAGLLAGLHTSLRHLLRSVRLLHDDAMLGHRTLGGRLGYFRAVRLVMTLGAVLTVAPVICFTWLPVPVLLLGCLTNGGVFAWALWPAFVATTPHDPRLTRATRRLTLVQWIYPLALVVPLVIA